MVRMFFLSSRTAMSACLAAGLLAASCQKPASEGPTELTIIRDDWGVPHIYTETEDAGYYGLGYAQAQDQGARVLESVLLVIGSAASIQGESGLPVDIEARRWMIAETSKQGYEDLSDHVKANYRAYVAGFNKYMDEHREVAKDFRFELEPWHLIAIPRGGLWNFYMAGDGIADCQRGGASMTLGQSGALTQRKDLASNEWALAPSRTKDGVAILLSDPHGGIDGGFMMEYRMHAGAFESAGYSIGGALLLPHTRNLAWGMTTGAPDLSDCYAIETDPDNPLRYQVDGVWKEMTTRTDTIEVKEGEPHAETFEYAQINGLPAPVIARQGEVAYVVSTPYMTDAAAFDEEIDQLNHARNVDEAKEAMRGLGMFAQNLMFADAEGNTWYVRAGRAPRRPEGYDWNKPVPGNTTATAWLGLHSIDDLVQVKNPETGYMQNNNISPDQMTLPPAVLNAADYPAYLFNDAMGRFNSRSVRANAVLAAAYDFTIDEAVELALDEQWSATGAWLGALSKAVDADPDRVGGWNNDVQAFLDDLLSFDGQARAESVPALRYYMWRQAVFGELDEGALEAALGAQWTDSLSAAVPAETLLAAVERAPAMMADLFGGADATIGDLARIGLGEKDYPIGGFDMAPWGERSAACRAAPCEFTLRAYWSRSVSESTIPVRVEGGSRILRLVAFTKPITSFTAHNFGQTDDPSSPHYDDQARLLASKRALKPVYFDRDALAGHEESSLTLVYNK